LSKDRPRVLAVLRAHMPSVANPARSARLSDEAHLRAALAELAMANCITDIAVVTTLDARDDAIAAFANASGILVMRAPDDDVLTCFARCAETTGADVIVHVTSAETEPARVDQLVSSLLAQRGDYVLDEDGSRSGIDVFSRRALDRLMMDARTDPLARRQVTGYLRAFPHFVRSVRATRQASSAFERARAAHERLDAQKGEASLGDIIGLVESDPARQAGASMPQGTRALIRCGDGAGMARTKRSIALARALRDGEGIVATFVVSGSEDTLDLVRRNGFEAEYAARDEGAQLVALASRLAPVLLVLDCEDGPSLLETTRLKREVTVVAVIDDLSSRRRVADIAYFPPLPRAEQLDWKGAQTIVRIGWQWVVARSVKGRVLPKIGAPRPTVLVTMGSAETTRLTMFAAGALATLPDAFRARFAIPSHLAERDRLARAVVALRSGFETIEGSDDPSTEFASADIAITDFGPAAFELAAAGVPALYLALNEDDAGSAARLEHAGMGLCLGLASEAKIESVAMAASQILSDPQRRRDMRAAALMTVDNNGANRIAADLAAFLAQRQKEPARANSA
jgi:spore coat polysaccharide biosynthesis protein SpsF